MIDNKLFIFGHGYIQFDNIAFFNSGAKGGHGVFRDCFIPVMEAPVGD